MDKYTAHVRMHHSGQLLMLDQDELETVIPQAPLKSHIPPRLSPTSPQLHAAALAVELP